MRPSRFRIACLAVAVALSAPACKKQERTLATVDGRAISQAEFDAYLRFKRLRTNEKPKVDEALDEYLGREALAAAIEKSGALDKPAIDAELREFRKEMLVSRYFEKFLAEKVTDDAVRNFYESHRDRYEEKKVHVAHILVRTNKAMSETERKAKLTTAQEIHSKLAAGADFGELAASASEDQISGKKGGDLGWLAEGSVDPRFSKRIFELKQGELSEPFETAFGFHIVKVVEGARTISRPFQAVSGDIRYELRNQAKQAELEALKKKLKIEKKDAYAPSAAPSAAAPAASALKPSGSSRSAPAAAPAGSFAGRHGGKP
jgi:peptidyl-prolyl cis-trans isomerase C